MSMLEWAKKEVEIAKAFESQDYVDGEFNYGGACYDSALKAFEALTTDGHSGMSIRITQNILNRLIDGKPLRPIEDIPEVWGEGLTDTADGVVNYQCIRASSLFKYVYPDGSIKYKDVDRMVCEDLDVPNNRFYSGFISRQVNHLFPITMPYMPTNKRFTIYCREFLVDPDMGDYDTIGIISVVGPNGESTPINRFFKESELGWDEIDEVEYNIRYESKISKE